MPRPQKRIETDGVRRAALYIRVSTEEQAMHGLSLAAQRETLLRYAEENGLRTVGVYADEGVTARKKYRSRTEFMRMLADVRAGNIDLILFIKLDRWFRNIADYYEVQKVLDDHGVQWIATEEDYDTTTANGRLHLNIKLSIAQDESDRTSERIKFVFDSKVKRGEVISGKVPLGYRVTDRRLSVDPETASMAQDIFGRYVALRSMRALRQYIMNQYGLVYSYSGLRALLQNTRYVGSAHDQDDFCPAIIEPETFDLVQTIISERAQRNGDLRADWVYLFTGLVRCAECGNRLSAHTVAGKYIYYRCTRYEKLHLCTHKKRTSELVLERWLLDNLVQGFTEYNLNLAEQAAQTATPVDEAKIKRKLEKLKDLYLNDLIDRDSYERDYTALRNELHTASNLKPLPEPVDIKALETALAAYTDLDRQHQKAFWSKTVSRIVISQEENFSVFPYSPYLL